MRKLFVFLLIALSNQAFTQIPGLFDGFKDVLGHPLPYFEKTDNPINPTVAYFYPSMLKVYTDPYSNEVTFGIGIPDGRFPQAKFEINGYPIVGGAGQFLYPALKVYGGIGLDVQGASRAIFIHNDDVNSTAYGIYQTGGENLKNYFNNKIGIGLVLPEKMLDIAGDLRCTGPAETGTGIILKSTDIAIPFPIYSNGTSIQFQFPYKIPSDQITPGQTFSLMTLTSNNEINQVEIAGTTKTLDLKVTNSTNTATLNVTNSTHTSTLDVANTTNTSTLNVGNQTTTKTFKMTDGAGWNKAMLSDGNGLGIWTDMNPFLDKYWSFAESNNDIFSHGRNVGIGTSATDASYYDNNKLTVYNTIEPTTLFVKNISSETLNRFGISSNLTDSDGSISGGGGVGIEMPTGEPGGSGPVSIGIESKVACKATGIGLTGISSTVSDNGTSSVPVYGIKSLINGTANTNQKYGLYSEIIGGNTNITPRWAGYFKGGDVEIDRGSFIIGTKGSKRFCMQTLYWLTDTPHALCIFPSNDNGTWESSYTLKGMSLYDNGNLTINGSLFADGKIYAREIEVTLDAYHFPDYVFAPDYKILPLNELETYIKTNQHLPEIPSAKDVKENGANLGEMNVALLKKVEELTLYIIEMKKEIEQLKSK